MFVVPERQWRVRHLCPALTSPTHPVPRGWTHRLQSSTTVRRRTGSLPGPKSSRQWSRFQSRSYPRSSSRSVRTGRFKTLSGASTAPSHRLGTPHLTASTVAVGVHPVCYPHAALEGSSGPRAGDDGRLSSPQRIAGAPCSVQAVGAELSPIHRSMWSVGPLESSRACTLRRHESSVLAVRIPGVLTTTTASHHSRRLGRVPTIITTSPTALLCSPFCFVRGIESVRSRDPCYRKKHRNQRSP